MKIFILINVLLCFVACTKQGASSRTETRKVGDREVDVTFPTAVWKAIENDYAEFNKKKEAEEVKEESSGEGREKEAKPKKKEVLSASESAKRLQVNKEELDLLLKRRPPSKNFAFNVQLTEKTDGVLGKINYDLQYPLGGGVLDLSHYIAEKPIGSFYLKVTWNRKEFPYDATRVYFISRSKERTIDGDKAGSGCEYFFEITKYFISSMKDDGFFLNTSKLRHVSLLSGIYYFVVFNKDGSMAQSSLEIIDSRHRELLCVPK